MLGCSTGTYDSQRVLIVDDRMDVRALLQARLGLASDIDVVGEAADGRAALSLVNTLRPDIVILDLEMPVMSGQEAIPLIRDASPATKIVVYSGSRASEISFSASAAPDAFVYKGGTLDELMSTLRDLARVKNVEFPYMSTA